MKSAIVPNYSKLYVVKPALLKLLGNVNGKRIFEIGCGNGFWLRILDSKGARCVGIDKSKTQISEAKKYAGRIKYYVGDATKLKISGSFDIVLLEKVLLEISDLREIRKILKQAYRVLKKNGFIVISDLHPIAPNCNLPNVRAEKDYKYFKSGAPIKIVSKRVDGGETIYIDYHWTFEDFFNAITDAGFKVTKVVEPRPSIATIKKYPYLRYRKDDPLSLMIKGVK